MRFTHPPSNVPDAKDDITQALYTLMMNVAEAASEGRMPDFGPESMTRGQCGHIAETIANLVHANCSPAIDAQTVQERFEKDAAEWKHRSRHMSTVYHMATLPSYQRIIGLGSDAVPHIIEDLRRKPNHWFWALNAIVGEDMAAGATTIPEAARRWVEWYDSNHPSSDEHSD